MKYRTHDTKEWKKNKNKKEMQQIMPLKKIYSQKQCSQELN